MSDLGHKVVPGSLIGYLTITSNRNVFVRMAVSSNEIYVVTIDPTNDVEEILSETITSERGLRKGERNVVWRP